MANKKLRWGILGVAKINDRMLPSVARERWFALWDQVSSFG